VTWQRRRSGLVERDLTPLADETGRCHQADGRRIDLGAAAAGHGLKPMTAKIVSASLSTFTAS
jgi:hypothetical protein